MHDVDLELDFEGFEPQDFHRLLRANDKCDVTLEDIENWLEEKDADPGYQVLFIGEIADTVQEEVTTQVDDGSSNELEEEV